MRAADIQPSRLDASKQAAKQFVKELPADIQIGIVAFASTALLVQSPTIDRSAIETAIDRLQLRRATAIGDAIMMSLATIFPNEHLDVGLPGSNKYSGMMGNLSNDPGYISRSLDQRGSADAVPAHEPVKPGSYDNAAVVLLTDGAATTGQDPIQAGQTAANYGVRVYTVGFGTPDGAVVDFGGFSMRAAPDLDTLKKIADATNAQFFNAQSADALTQVYKSLSAKLTSERKLTEVSFILAGLGALLAMAAAGLSLLWFGRIA
jgi:Ca-activated chloride channel family protein